MHDRIEEQEIANIKKDAASLKSKVGTVPSGKTVQGQITELAEALAALTTRVETLEG